jgi:hypothetical protein
MNDGLFWNLMEMERLARGGGDEKE